MTKESKKPEAAPKKSIEELMEGTKAGEFWKDIKDREIFMFALPNQRVSQHVRPILVDPDKLYVILNSTAALPSLEEAVAKSDPKRGIVGYSVELADRFVIITPAPIPLSEKLKDIK